MTLKSIECKRCHKELITLTRSIFKLDQLKEQYGSLCRDCITEDERNDLNQKLTDFLVSFI